MATILTKRSNTASSVPVAGDLTNSTGGAELAVNTADKRLFTKDSGGTVVELGTNPSTFSLPNGTANGVPYLNGSKVLTSGSALTFNGTSFGVPNIDLNNGGTQYFYSSGFGSYFALTNNANALTFGYNGSEQMRLTSTGLGIGTSSPSYKLQVNSTGNIAYFRDTTNNTGLYMTGTASDARVVSDGKLSLQGTNGGGVAIVTASTERVFVDNSGNLGLGVTPSAWGSSYKALEIGGVVSYLSSANQYFGKYANAYRNSGGTLIYTTTGVASGYLQNLGAHQWFTAPSGTAGNAISFTQAMTLDASGNQLLGATSQSVLGERLLVNGAGIVVQSAAATNRGMLGNFGGSDFIVGSYDSIALAFRTGNTERARIDSSGNLLVGTTGRVSLEKLSVTTTGETQAALFKNDTNNRANIVSWVATTTGDAVFSQFYTETSITNRGSISYNRGSGVVAYNTTSDYRAKDILGLVTDSGAVIDSVPVYMGKMKGATQERPMFVAHETPPYAHTGEKDAVDADGNPVYQQMDASTLVPVMWAEIQSLRKRVAALEAA